MLTIIVLLRKKHPMASLPRISDFALTILTRQPRTVQYLVTILYLVSNTSGKLTRPFLTHRLIYKRYIRGQTRLVHASFNADTFYHRLLIRRVEQAVTNLTTVRVGITIHISSLQQSLACRLAQ